MKLGLKEKVEMLQEAVKDVESYLMMNNKFEGAGYVAVIVSDSLGKALGLKKEVYGYVLASVSTNGALRTVENMVQDFINELPAESSGAKLHTVLL
jgi:hypothetical protein